MDGFHTSSNRESERRNKMKNFKHVITGLVVLGLVALGANVFARMGTGGGYGHGTGHGTGWGMGRSTGDEMNRFHEEKASFMKETETLRQRLYQKNLELKAELSKTNVDAATVSNMKKEISSIEASIDQKRLGHRSKLNQIKSGLGHMSRGSGEIRHNDLCFATG